MEEKNLEMIEVKKNNIYIYIYIYGCMYQYC